MSCSGPTAPRMCARTSGDHLPSTRRPRGHAGAAGPRIRLPATGKRTCGAARRPASYRHGPRPSRRPPRPACPRCRSARTSRRSVRRADRVRFIAASGGPRTAPRQRSIPGTCATEPPARRGTGRSASRTRATIGSAAGQGRIRCGARKVEVRAGGARRRGRTDRSAPRPAGGTPGRGRRHRETRRRLATWCAPGECLEHGPCPCQTAPGRSR